MIYDKLVRDKIPEIIKKKGQVPIVHIASESEFLQKLKKKLREEVEEFIVNEKEEEIIDILEAINGICEFRGIDRTDLEKRREAKLEERGGFTKRIILDEVR